MSRQSKIIGPAGAPSPDAGTKADAERITATLEALLANPVPGITIRRVEAADERSATTGLDPAGRPAAAHAHPTAPEAAPPPATAPSPPTRKPGPATAARQAAAAPAPAPRPAAPSSTVPRAAEASRAAPAPAQTDAAAAPRPFPHLPSPAQDRLSAFVNGGSGAESPADARADDPVRPAGPERRAAPARVILPAAAGAAADSEIGRALLSSRRTFLAIGLFSVVINVLMLAGPLFMLQIYDRVLSSGSIPTLVALLGLTALVYGIIGFLELVRSRTLTRTGIEVDQRLGDRIFEAGLRRSIATRGSSASALRELDSLRQFLAGPAPATLFDAPWTVVYLLVIFLVHWSLGLVATLGTVALLLIAFAGEARSRPPLMEASRAAQRSVEMAETGQRNAESVLAMGMLPDYRARWQAANGQALIWQIIASDRLGTTSAISRTIRLLMQSVMLALGAALALEGQISAGSIIAATIIYGRALAPIEQLIGQWRAFMKAFESYGKLAELLAKETAAPARTQLPRPQGRLDVAGLKVAAPETRTPILSGLTFHARPGQMLAIIGPSGSGKSTLARAIVGLWPAAGGTIALDGAQLDHWNTDDLGRHIGYLPQDVELFAGSVRDNIARFRPDAADAAVIAAARAAHAHELILSLPKGYDTELGAFGMHLSAGQRQRIALARALFEDPALVVLDEPNANLDRLGDEALAAAIDGMRSRGQTVIVVSHRVQAIAKADTLLFLDRGQQKAFGPRDEVMELIRGAQAARSGDTPRSGRAGAPGEGDA